MERHRKKNSNNDLIFNLSLSQIFSHHNNRESDELLL
jgi:hypothetical protein